MLRAIDISLLSLNALDRATAINALEMLNKTRELLIYYKNFGHLVGVSSDVILVLSQNGKYPDIRYIKDFIDSHNLGEIFEPHEVSRAVSDILLNYENIDSRLVLKDYLVSKCDFDPDISVNYTSPQENENANALLVKMTAQSQFDDDLGIYAAYSSEVACCIEFQMAIDRDECEILEGQEISSTISFLQPADALMEEHDVMDEWLKAEDKNSVLNILSRVSQGTGMSVEISESFFETLLTNGCVGNRKYSSQTFKVCRGIIRNSANFKNNPFLSDKSRGIQAVSRDGLLGWRVHVTGGGEAIRLMFWEAENKIRFSVVGPKNECEIIDD